MFFVLFSTKIFTKNFLWKRWFSLPLFSCPHCNSKETISKPALNRICIQSIYCFNYCLHVEFGTAALLGDSCAHSWASAWGGGPGVSPQLVPQKFPPKISSGTAPAAPQDAVDVSILHHGDPNPNWTGKDGMVQIKPKLSWAGRHRGASLAAAGEFCRMIFVKICLLTPWLHVPSSFRRAKLAHAHEGDQAPSLRAFPLLKPSQIIQRFHIMRPEPKCFAPPAAAVAFVVEPTWVSPVWFLDYSWHFTAPAGTKKHTQEPQVCHQHHQLTESAVDTWRKRCPKSESCLKQTENQVIFAAIHRLFPQKLY